jgi:hypothetical protein
MLYQQYVDALIDGLYTAGATLLGYMVASGGAVIPTKAAVLVAAVTGLVGGLNQLRGLRKAP